MTSTFLSLIVISGIMSGLMGIVLVLLGNMVGIDFTRNKSYILNSESLINFIKNDDRVVGYHAGQLANIGIQMRQLIKEV